MAAHPQILAVCDQLLPEDVQRESSGVGGAAAGPTGAKAAAADAKRREACKKRAKEDNAHLKPAKKQPKTESVQDTAAVAMQSVASGLGLPPGGLSELFGPAGEPAPTAAASSRDIVEGKAANLNLFDTLLENFQRAAKDLREAEAAAATGDKISSKMAQMLKIKIAKIEVEMDAWDL